MSELVEEERFDIFVSYAEVDRAWVEGYLLDGLQSASLKTIAQHDFRPGVPALLEFERAVKESRYTLLVISTAWLATNNSSFIEVLAQTWGTETNSWPVIPLLLEEAVLPARLSMLVPVDMRDVETRAQALVRLCKQLQAAVPRNNQSPACPYPGMVAFSEKESRYFFGRDQEIETITQKLRYYPFICVIGASGSGKSSLVFAGLIPALRQSKLFGEGEWRVVDMRPGEHPLTTFQTSVAAGRSGKGDNSERLLLVVDQFEETFAANREEAEKFIKALLEFYQQPNCFLVLTVRADFYDALIKSNLWSEIQSHRVEITGLNEQNLRSAIVKPAETVGVYIEGVLVERLLVGAGQEPGVLPILQEIMVRLWQRLERRLLPLRAYESLILPYKKDGLSTLQALLAQFADEIVAQLPADQQVIARRIFVRLVQFGEGRADTRRQQSIPDLRIVGESENAFEQTLSHLVNRRLLTVSSDKKGQRYVDIAHEKMIERWPTLQAWIRDRRETEEMRRRLETRAHEWELSSHNYGFLLRGSLLRDAEIWKRKSSFESEECSTRLQELLRQSRLRHRLQWVNYTIFAGVGTVIVVSIIAYFINLYYVYQLNQGWSLIDAPLGGVSVIASSPNEILLGSYHYGAAWKTENGKWIGWHRKGLPESVQAKNNNVANADVRIIGAVAFDTQNANQKYAFVSGGGVYRYFASEDSWQSLGRDEPTNSLAKKPFAVFAQHLLLIGDVKGLFHFEDVEFGQNRSWQNLGEIDSELMQEWAAIAFDGAGTPFLGGKGGLYRGHGKFPWQWQRLPIEEDIYDIAISPFNTLFIVTQNQQHNFSLGCYNLNGEKIGPQFPIPIANHILKLFQADLLEDVIGSPTQINRYFAVDNYGAVYTGECNGNWYRIGQGSVKNVPFRLAVQLNDNGAIRLILGDSSELRIKTVK